MTAPVLWIADPDGDFIECTNASKEGLRGVLLQNNHAICYESWKLKEHEKNYPTHDLELAAIIHTVKMWRNYLMGRNFLLKTKIMCLKYLFDQPDLGMQGKLGGWLSLVSTISS